MKAKSTKKVTNTTSDKDLPRFRLCVMGKMQKGKKLVRVRRMKYVPAATYEAAADAMAKFGPELAKGMVGNIFTQIAAPLQ